MNPASGVDRREASVCSLARFSMRDAGSPGLASADPCTWRRPGLSPAGFPPHPGPPPSCQLEAAPTPHPATPPPRSYPSLLKPCSPMKPVPAYSQKLTSFHSTLLCRLCPESLYSFLLYLSELLVHLLAMSILQMRALGLRGVTCLPKMISATVTPSCAPFLSSSSSLFVTQYLSQKVASPIPSCYR